MNPGRGIVDLQRTAIKYFRETGSHLYKRRKQSSESRLWISGAQKCQPGFNKLELELELEQRQPQNSVEPKYLQNAEQHLSQRKIN